MLVLDVTWLALKFGRFQNSQHTGPQAWLLKIKKQSLRSGVKDTSVRGRK
jgi:hypothetical protein